MPSEQELAYERRLREEQHMSPSPAPQQGGFNPLDYEPMTMTRDILAGFGTDMLRGGVQFAGNVATMAGTRVGETVAAIAGGSMTGAIDPELSGLDENLDRFNQAFNEMVPSYTPRTEGGKLILNAVYGGIAELTTWIYGTEDPAGKAREIASRYTDDPYLQRSAMVIPAVLETVATMGAGVGLSAAKTAAMSAGRRGAGRMKDAYSKVTGKEPIPEVPVTDAEAGRIMREGSPDEIAKAMEIDIEIVDEMGETGVNPTEMPWSSYANNEYMQRIMSAVERYGPESDAQRRNQLIDQNLRQQGDKIIDAYNTAPEPYLLGERWELATTKYASNLAQSASEKYETVKQSVRPGDRVEAPAVVEFTNNLLDKYGKLKFLPKEYKPMVTRLQEAIKGSKELDDLYEIFGENPTNPQGKAEIAAAKKSARGLTIDILMDMRDEVKLAERKRKGPYQDLTDNRLEELRGIVDSDIQLYLDEKSALLDEGLNLAQMNQAADVQWAQKKKIEEIYTEKMGGKYTNGLINIVTSSITDLAKSGNPKPYKLLMSQIREPDIEHALPIDKKPEFDSVVKLDRLQKETALSGFAGAVEQMGMYELMRELNKKPAASRPVFEDLPPKLVSTMNTIEMLGTKIEKRSLGKGPGLPSLNKGQVKERMQYPEMVFDRVASGLARLYYYPAMVVGRGALIIRNFRAEPVELAAKMMDDPKLHENS